MVEARKIAAILASDVVGYSRLAGADEDRILARLRALRGDLIDPTIAVHHGRVVKRTGDGALVEFRSVVEAVRCALEVQNAMVERNAGVAPEQRIVFRIGVHLGDVVEESDGDLMGDGVNIAARLEGVAAPGAICLSEDAYRQVKGRLDLAVADLGPTRLKNIAEPMRVYSLQVGNAARVKRATRKWPLQLAPALAAIAALAIIVGSAVYVIRVPSKAPPVAARLSLVVLPFANLSGDAAQDYLADALTDELTTGLTRMHGSFIIARNTAFTYKGKSVDAKAIGKDLGVRYVLEGSVQPSGGQIRVNAQLIDGETGAHVWADQFDTPRADLLQMQDEIVTHLSRALGFQLTQAEVARLKRTSSANLGAEDLALRCRAGAEKPSISAAQTEAAYHLCEQALAADPNNVRALYWLSLKRYNSVVSGASADPKGDVKRGEELISRALAHDPNWSPGHELHGLYLALQGRIDESVFEEERALVLDPTNLTAVRTQGFNFGLLGQFEKSLEYGELGLRLSPHDSDAYLFYHLKGFAYLGLNKLDQSIESSRLSIAMAPNNIWPHYNVIAALSFAGRAEEGREALQSYLASIPNGPKTIAAWKVVLAPYMGPKAAPRFVELTNRELDSLRKAGMPEE